MKIEGKLIKIQHSPKGGQEWVARLVGKDTRFGFQRVFLPPVSKNWSATGRTGITIFELGMEGIYEINEPWKGRTYIHWDGQKSQIITPEEAINKIERRI